MALRQAMIELYEKYSRLNFESNIDDLIIAFSSHRDTLILSKHMP